MAVGGEVFVKCFDDFLNEKPNLVELCEYVRVDPNKWYKFGVLLELDTNDLDNINQHHNESDMKALKMFQLWLESNPEGTRRDIIDTLRKQAIGQNTLAGEYIKVLRESEPSHFIYIYNNNILRPAGQFFLNSPGPFTANSTQVKSLNTTFTYARSLRTNFYFMIKKLQLNFGWFLA